MKKELMQLRPGGGHMQHLVDSTATALCNYKPIGTTGIGRKRAKWYRAPEGMSKCAKCQKKAIEHPLAPEEWKILPCKVCGKPTKMLSTKMCDGCWEIHHRMGPQMEDVRWHHCKWYKVRAYSTETDREEVYRVAAPSEQDARLIAFAMSGGFENYGTFEGKYDMERALKHTEIEG